MKILRRLLVNCFYILILILLCYYVVIPKEIEKRARALNLMHYDSVKDGFVGNDSISMSDWDLYYLQHGNMKGY